MYEENVMMQSQTFSASIDSDAVFAVGLHDEPAMKHFELFAEKALRVTEIKQFNLIQEELQAMWADFDVPVALMIISVSHQVEIPIFLTQWWQTSSQKDCSAILRYHLWEVVSVHRRCWVELVWPMVTPWEANGVDHLFLMIRAEQQGEQAHILVIIHRIKRSIESDDAMERKSMVFPRTGGKQLLLRQIGEEEFCQRASIACQLSFDQTEYWEELPVQDGHKFFAKNP